MQKTEMSILEILTEDARTPASEIAVMLGKEEAEIRETIERLEKQRIILRYPALINWEKVDIDEVEALIEVRVTPQRDEGFDAIAEQIYRFEEVSSVYLMSGAYDLMLIVEGKNIRAVSRFVSERLSILDNVQSCATHFILKRYKTDGVIFEKQPGDKRMVVSL